MPIRYFFLHPFSDHFAPCNVQIESEFPMILPIKESLIKYVFEPASKQVRVSRLETVDWDSFSVLSCVHDAEVGAPGIRQRDEGALINL